MSLYYKLCIFIFTVFTFSTFNTKDPYQLSKIDILNYSQPKLAEYKWFKVKKTICNDEYDKWLCCDFYYSKNKKIHVVYSDISGTDPHYIETNLNLFQKNMHLKINDLLKDSVLDGKYYKLNLNDEGTAEIEEFDTTNKNKYLYVYNLSCSEELSGYVNEVEHKLESKTNRKIPKAFERCKITSCKIFKNFDYRNKLFHKP